MTIPTDVDPQGRCDACPYCENCRVLVRLDLPVCCELTDAACNIDPTRATPGVMQRRLYAPEEEAA